MLKGPGSRKQIFDFKTIDYQGWKLNVYPKLPDEIIGEIIGSLNQLKPTLRSYRHRGFIQLSPLVREHTVYVKCNMLRYTGLAPSKIRLAVSALRAGYILNEGYAYTEYSRRGIMAPPLYLFGEYKVLGIRSKEIIAIGRVEGDTVKKKYQESGDEELVYKASEFLAKVHNKGFAHGDCMLHNFMLSSAGVQIIDLEYATRLTEKTQQKDLIDFGSSVLRVTGNIRLLEKIFRHYVSLSTPTLVSRVPELVSSSIDLVKRKPFDTVYIPYDKE